MREFEYLQPETIIEASEMLAEYKENCRLMAGGTALLLALRQRMLPLTHIISVRRLKPLRGISYDAKLGLRIGALSLHHDIARSPLVQQHRPMLADMASRLANPQVRNQGTIGGNLCYADPATDPPSCLMALDAQVVLVSRRGRRTMPIEEFIVDYYTTALEPDEMVLELIVPSSALSEGHHARHLRTAAEHRPLVNFAIAIDRDKDVCNDVRMVVGASTVTPTRTRGAEDFLRGKSIDRKVVAEAADIAANEIEPIDDSRGAGEYRREMVRVTGRRTLERLFGLTVELEAHPT